MDAIVLDETLYSVAIIDSYNSLIWTERFQTAGGFELSLPPTRSNFETLTLDRYLALPDSSYVMLIEEVELITDSESGDELIVRGRTADAAFDRRIVWSETILNTGLQHAFRRVLSENALHPVDPNRRLPLYEYSATTDTSITSLNVDTVLHGETVFSVLETFCHYGDIGYRVNLELGKLALRLFSGADRSFNQTANPYVVFSPEYENLTASNFLQTNKTLLTTVLVAGEGEGAARKTRSVSTPNNVGMGRREAWIEASDISSNVETGALSDADYQTLLEQRGWEALGANTSTTLFDGQNGRNNTFKYGRDFFIGDIVQLVNGYGLGSASRVVEYIRSFSPEGVYEYPTFANIS